MAEMQFRPAGKWCEVFIVSDDGQSSYARQIPWDEALEMVPMAGRLALRLMRERGTLTYQQIVCCYAASESVRADGT